MTFEAEGLLGMTGSRWAPRNDRSGAPRKDRGSRESRLAPGVCRLPAVRASGPFRRLALRGPAVALATRRGALGETLAKRVHQIDDLARLGPGGGGDLLTRVDLALQLFLDAL